MQVDLFGTASHVEPTKNAHSPPHFSRFLPVSEPAFTHRKLLILPVSPLESDPSLLQTRILNRFWRAIPALGDFAPRKIPGCTPWQHRARGRPHSSVIHSRAFAVSSTGKNLRHRGNHKTEDSDRMPNPINIGNHGDTLPAKDMLHADFEIVPYGAGINPGKVGVDLIIKTQLASVA